MPGATYLEEIVTAHRVRSLADRRPVDELVDRAQSMAPTRGFARALVADTGLAVIAEVKRRSPSKGDLAPDLDPAALAGEYSAGGAAALSVLTDEDYFGARPSDLGAARAACELPVLRKDFTVSEADVCDARLMGADAVLLIVAALSDDELARFSSMARRLAIDALVEVHDEAELARALDVGSAVVGVNQRDLTTFAVDPERALRLAQAVPDGVVAVAESGIRGGGDARRLADAGYDAVLVGETLVTAGDPRATLEELAGHRVRDRRDVPRGRGRVGADASDALAAADAADRT